MATTNNFHVDQEYLRYFVFSKEQLNVFTRLNERLGRPTVVPTVFVAGRRKQYTEMLKDPTKCRYSDYKIVAAGDIRTMQFTEWTI
jgi:hypothetical protein